jgi:hypothetical protein
MEEVIKKDVIRSSGIIKIEEKYCGINVENRKVRYLKTLSSSQVYKTENGKIHIKMTKQVKIFNK